MHSVDRTFSREETTKIFEILESVQASANEHCASRINPGWPMYWKHEHPCNFTDLTRQVFVSSGFLDNSDPYDEKIGYVIEFCEVNREDRARLIDSGPSIGLRMDLGNLRVQVGYGIPRNTYIFRDMTDLTVGVYGFRPPCLEDARATAARVALRRQIVDGIAADSELVLF